MLLFTAAGIASLYMKKLLIARSLKKIKSKLTWGKNSETIWKTSDLNCLL